MARFLGPSLIGVVLFVAGPIVASLALAFTSWDLLTPPTFVGLRNFERLSRDVEFWAALRHPVTFLAGNVPLVLVTGPAVAVALHGRVPGRPHQRVEGHRLRHGDPARRPSGDPPGVLRGLRLHALAAAAPVDVMRRPWPLASAFATLAIVAGAFVMLVPFAWMLSTSLKPGSALLVMPPRFIPDEPTIGPYRSVAAALPILRAFFDAALVITTGQRIVASLSG